MAIEHDTDPNYPVALGDRPSFGKLNYGPQMRAETDPDFLTPPATQATKATKASEANFGRVMWPTRVLSVRAKTTP